MLKSTPEIFWVPKEISILGEKKIFVDNFRKIEIFFSAKIGFFFGAEKIFRVDLSPGRPPNRIFLGFFTSEAVENRILEPKNQKNAIWWPSHAQIDPKKFLGPKRKFDFG